MPSLTRYWTMREENRSFISVKELNALIKEALEGNLLLQNVYVKGEISNWKKYASGIYFSIKDSESLINCIMWNSYASALSFVPKEGDEVLIFGSINVYIGRGNYSLIAKRMEPYGRGAALLELEKLKKKLAEEGLFDEERKKKIPLFPKNIGIIVGRNSAAEADLIKNISRRWPLAQIYDFPAVVQGKEAPASLIKALKKAEEYPLDTLIISRGGGSQEDLWAYNDEKLVRECAACPFPLISAVGHEIDFTLVDFVASVRVSTPTGAAEKATPNKDDVYMALAAYEEELSSTLEKKISRLREKLEALSSRPFFKNPSEEYSRKREELGKIEKRLLYAYGQFLTRKKEAVALYGGKLESLSPKKVLARGYSMATNEKGEIIGETSQIKEGEIIKTVFSDGSIYSEVLRKEKE